MPFDGTLKNRITPESTDTEAVKAVLNKTADIIAARGHCRGTFRYEGHVCCHTAIRLAVAWVTGTSVSDRLVGPLADTPLAVRSSELFCKAKVIFETVSAFYEPICDYNNAYDRTDEDIVRDFRTVAASL